ncbi:MAG: discoidin domain-containing protein [Planctomycetota bacterium]
MNLTAIFAASTVSVLFLTAPLSAQNGTLLGNGRVGIGFNNAYTDGDNKLDWLRFNADPNSTLVESLDYMDNIVDGGFTTFRCGWSRNMALDPADLEQWIDGVEEVIDHGNEVMIVFWGAYGDGSSKIQDAVGDAALWQFVINRLNDRGLMGSISGFEIQNEPDGSASGWRDYVRQVWKKVGPHGNVGWQNLTQQQRDETAAAWFDKPIVVQGTTFGQKFSSTLVNGLDGLNNIVWSLHAYSKFSGITSERENWTVEQWQAHYVGKWMDDLDLIGSNVIITELGTNNSFGRDLVGMGPAGTTADDRRDAGFVRASHQRFGQNRDTTIFWYTAYNVASIGLGERSYSAWHIFNLHALNFINNSEFEPSTSGLVNVAIGKPVTTSSERSGDPGFNAVDGNKLTDDSRWLTPGSANTPHWLAVDLTQPYLLSQVRIYNGYGETQYRHALREFSIQRRVNGTWQDIAYRVGNNNSAITIQFPPVIADEVRLLINEATDETVRVYEFEIYADPTFVVAHTITPTRGEFVSGGVLDIAASDNTDYTMQRNSFDIQSRTEFEVESVSPVADPSQMSITFEGSVFARSAVTQSVELFNYDAQNWELVDSRNASRFSDTATVIGVNGDLSRFVEPGSLTIEARVRYRSVNPRQQFSSNTDQFIWTIE